MRFLSKIILTVLFLGVTLFAKDVATITAINGEAFVERAGVKSVLSLGYKLQEKDKILTSDKSKVQIIFEDETIVTVGKKSNFSINEYLFEAGNEPVAKFGMLKGAMRTITGKIGKIAPDKFSVKTKTATIGIRGTNFTILEGDDGSQRVYCTFGAISVSVNGQEIVVQQGFYVYIAPDGKTETREFSAEELKEAQKDGFGEDKAKKGKANEDGDLAQNDGQIDTTKEEGNSVVVKEITEETQDAVQQKEDSTEPTTEPATEPTTSLVTAALKGCGVHNNSDSSFIANININNNTFSSSSLTDEDQSKVAWTYTLATTPTSFTSKEKFNVDITSISTTDTGITDIQLNSTGNYFNATGDDLADGDYMSWGEWGVSYTYDTESSRTVTGLWVAGQETEASVVSALSGSANYAGKYRAIDISNNGTIVNGNASLSVDFGADTASLTISQPDGTEWATYENMSISGNQVSGSQNSYNNSEVSNTGTASGRFYGPNAESVGGSFVIIDDGVSMPATVAKGVYQVTK